jgi:alanine dehydrogenase
MPGHNRFQSIAVVREIESPENPSGLEKRVSVVPQDIGTLLQTGADVYVEEGAGLGVGFSDEEYVKAGAILQPAREIYRDKDLIIKFKGPSLESIAHMRPGCTLLCMAHFGSFPDRARVLEENKINVIAMEEIVESPKIDPDQAILSRTAMASALQPYLNDNSIGGLDVRVLQWSPRTLAAIRRAGNRDPRSLKVIHSEASIEQLDATGPTALYFYDSASTTSDHLIEHLMQTDTNLFDLVDYDKNHGQTAIEQWRETHPPLPFGLRRIQCLHQTGQAGARYGLELLAQNKPNLDVQNAKVVVLGYGNVAQGAMRELSDKGVREINVLGLTHTKSGRIEYWLKDADLIVNGADQPVNLRGRNYLVENRHLEQIIPDGSVIIDLVGGSPTNRSPIEPVLSCTFLTEPHFVTHGVTVSALWGWPMLGMMRETAITYSGQIVDVIAKREMLINGLDSLAPGVQRALVCGPHTV